MRLATLLALFAPLAVAPAQISTAGVVDVGLTMQTMSPVLSATSIVGQVCGPFTCVPFSAPNATTTSLSSTRRIRIYGDANSLWILGMSTTPVSTPCLPIPGFGNALILGQPLVVVAWGVTGPLLPGPTVACQQAVATYNLTLPPVAPQVLPFFLQAVVDSHATGTPAFTVAVRGFAH
jgi:hypothetical protein